MKKYDNGKYIKLSQKEVNLLEQEEERLHSNYLNYTTYEELVNLKIRERYSESHEFAILRQKYEKPEEFKEYYVYCEECKKQAKELFKIRSDTYGG